MSSATGTVWGGPNGLVWVVGTGEDSENRFQAFMRQQTIKFPGSGIDIMDSWRRKGAHKLSDLAPSFTDRETPLLVHLSREGRIRRIVWCDPQLEPGRMATWEA